MDTKELFLSSKWFVNYFSTQFQMSLTLVDPKTISKPRPKEKQELVVNHYF